MDRKLAKTVLALFREPPLRSDELARFGPRHWERSYDWLDTSGMALYLLDRLKKLQRESEIPATTLQRLEENQRDNRARTEQLLSEFKEINRSFQHAGLRYVNLKGMSLVPSYCPNPELRFQVDLDFLLDASEAKCCQEILSARGYRMTGTSGKTWEFKTGGDMIPTLRDMYKPKAQRSIEIHFGDSNPRTNRFDDRLSRIQMQRWCDIEFPALSETDKFVAQSVHLARHLRSEWIRLSWVLEYWTFLRARKYDVTFWNDVRELAKDDLTMVTAIGMAHRIAAFAFEEPDVPFIAEWTREALPKHLDRWIEHFGEDVLLMEFPGSKLYLLLESHVMQKQEVMKSRVKKLFPSHLPPRIVYCVPGASIREKWKGYIDEVRYVLFRCRFHVISGIRYILETVRWKCVVRDGGLGNNLHSQAD